MPSPLRAAFAESQPDFPLLAADRPELVESLMRRLGWLRSGERVRGCERAGEGNMNLTLRVRTSSRSVILKQSRPWVEKYDSIAAPFDRVLVERRFYERVAGIPGVATSMPRLLGADDEARVLLLEDLGEAQDLTGLYRQGELTTLEARALGAYLRALHGATRGQEPAGLENREMRALDHEHIFVVPYRADNGVDLERLEPGSSVAARRLREDLRLRSKVADLGERYLADGPVLVHGDFFPGSWLRARGRLFVIDPEFCFFGDAELDLGVAVAHLVLSRQSFRVGEELIRAAVDPGSEVAAHESLVARYAGVEVIRRLIGVAQLPIAAPTDGFRAGMLERARVAILEETLEAFRT
jgi:5-methylthioribose kinase